MELWVLFSLGLALSRLWGSLWAVSRVRGSAPVRASPSGVYPAWGVLFGLGLARLLGSLWAVPKVESSTPVCASPSEVSPARKLQWHFTCGFDFRHSLWFVFVGFAVLKGLTTILAVRFCMLLMSFRFDAYIVVHDERL